MTYIYISTKILQDALLVLIFHISVAAKCPVNTFLMTALCISAPLFILFLSQGHGTHAGLHSNQILIKVCLFSATIAFISKPLHVRDGRLPSWPLRSCSVPSLSLNLRFSVLLLFSFFFSSICFSGLFLSPCIGDSHAQMVFPRYDHSYISADQPSFQRRMLKVSCVQGMCRHSPY